MKEKTIKKGSQRMIQQNLFGVPDNRLKRSKFISTYRITLVRDRRVAFETCQLVNSRQSQPLIKKLIATQGQPDREQQGGDRRQQGAHRGDRLADRE